MKRALLLACLVGGAASAGEPARPVQDARLAYAGPVWQAWRFPDRKRGSLVIVRTHAGKLVREVTLPKKHRFCLLLGNGTVVTAPRDNRYVTLLDADGKRADLAPYIWKRATRFVAAYRDGIVVQTEEKGTGHLFFVPWRNGTLQPKNRVRVTRHELLVDPAPSIARHGSKLVLKGFTFDLPTKVAATIEGPPATPSLYDGKTFVDARLGFHFRDGTVYALHRKPDGVHLIARSPGDARPRVLADFRVPEGDTGAVVRGRDALSFKPKLRGWRHVRWDREGLVLWNGKSWVRVAWQSASAGE